ncbi:class I SAM-dependent RNA methyltransferase [Nocardioides daejeonensis]|uniref:class I SAM-dependent RNA methyltransferase n=1 Tax=Nocardioides daejeonensis TaxID=1046556 RepID=UPI0019502290|nr:TRAM domain-containing protein [Nocardioides daejeonensis]
MAERHNRRRRPKGASLRGRRFEVLVGPVAHGGHCVARIAELGDRVVFVRHALPGERVVVEVTEGTEGDRFLRGDAVDVLVRSEARVEAPCPVAGPGGCGGCDFQHVALPEQRALKTAVVLEQLHRIGRLPSDHPALAGFEVVAVPGDRDGLRWRSRSTFVTDSEGRRGMRRHRSHEVVPVEDCLIAAPHARQPGEGGPEVVTERVVGAGSVRTFQVASDGFWQVHPGAPAVLVDTVLELLAPRAGEQVLDLYAGVGLFSAFLADAVGADGAVLAVEGGRSAVEHARANLADLPWAVAEAGDVAQVLAQREAAADVVVLDPPRAGAKREVIEQVLRRRPRAVALVACDPAALARDVGIFRESGWELSALRGFDLFPMTHHVECVALLTKAGPGPR